MNRRDPAAIRAHVYGGANPFGTVPQREQLGMVQAAQVVPFPAAAINQASFRQALGECLLGALEIIDTPLQLAFGDAAVVEGIPCLAALVGGVLLRFFGRRSRLLESNQLYAL
jgi:hypothetical protein